MTRVQATVILPVRDGAATIGEQLAALAAQDFAVPWELIVVDNGSTDGTRQVVDDWSGRLPNMRVIFQPEGAYALACNTAVQSAKSERILFCESDDVVSPGWVRAMVAALEECELVGGALEFDRLNSPRVRASRRAIQSKRLPVLFGYRPYTLGANLGVSRPAFDRVGGFDASFIGGAVDTDLSWRVQLSGRGIRFAPDAVIHYRLRSSLSGLLKQQYRYAREDECLYAKFWRLGVMTMRPVARYQNALLQLLKTLWETPRLLRANQRWGVLAQFAHCAGRFAGIFKARLVPSLALRPRRHASALGE